MDLEAQCSRADEKSQLGAAQCFRFHSMEPFGWNYKPAEKHCWLIFCERKILFWLKKQAEQDGL
jgi:hypothetical protein